MPRRRLFIVGIALLVAVGIAAGTLTAASQERKHRLQHEGYAVAAASVSNPDGRPGVAIAGRRGIGPLPETLTLVFVGSLLIGLAAAVRRTT